MDELASKLSNYRCEDGFTSSSEPVRWFWEASGHIGRATAAPVRAFLEMPFIRNWKVMHTTCLLEGPDIGTRGTWAASVPLDVVLGANAGNSYFQSFLHADAFSC